MTDRAKIAASPDGFYGNRQGGSGGGKEGVDVGPGSRGRCTFSAAPGAPPYRRTNAPTHQHTNTAALTSSFLHTSSFVFSLSNFIRPFALMTLLYSCLSIFSTPTLDRIKCNKSADFDFDYSFQKRINVIFY